jgi:hypothetical protein
MTHKLLIDLKPAFDGYAGIPQESRLLFAALSQIEEFEVEGLIQHGSQYLASGLKANSTPSSAKKINKLGKLIISITSPRKSTSTIIKGFFRHQLLRINAIFFKRLKLSFFEANDFQDFIWRTFFNKTLTYSYKTVIAKLNYRVLQASRHTLHKVGLDNRFLGYFAIYPKIDTKDIKFLLAQAPFPARVSKETILLVRYHDAVPLLMPHTISDSKFHQMSHFHALQENVNAGAWFVCVSESTRQELLKLFPEVEQRSVVIHNIVSDEFFPHSPNKIRTIQIINDRLGKIEDKIKKGKSSTESGKIMPTDLKNITAEKLEYLLIVSTIEPRKNYSFLIQVFEELKLINPNIKLVIVGSLGWGYAPIVESFYPLAARGELFYLNNVPANDLRTLYQNATATICPSVSEGFDYSGIEAMRCGSIVIASDIPVHREIYDNACAYFDPYNIQHATQIIGNTIASNKIIHELTANSQKISKRYSKENIFPQWEKFLNQLI